MVAPGYGFGRRYWRAKRTREFNRVRGLIHSCMTMEAPYLGQDGLPSWWPFWSDRVASATRDLVRTARTLEAVEAWRGDQ